MFLIEFNLIPIFIRKRVIQIVYSEINYEENVFSA